MDKKKKAVIIVAVAAIAAVATYFGVTYFLDRDLEQQESELKKLEQETVETKSGQVVETELYNIADGEFYVKIPVDFTQMSQELLAKKYPAGNLPSYAFSNEDGTINVVFNVTEDSMTDEEIEPFIESMANLSTTTDSTKPETSVSENSGHVIGSIKMTTPAADTDIYNNMIIFAVDGKLRIVSFNCTEELREEWENVGDFIIESLHFPVE